MQQTNSFKGIVMLLLCSFIWGTAFVAQSVGADLLGPFSFNGIRSFLGAFFLVPCIAVIDRLSGKPLSFWGTDDSHKRGDLITGGLCCGVLLTIASTLQQTGIAYTSAGKAGFITALYIVIIPILGLLVKKHVTFMQWAAVAVAAAFANSHHIADGVNGDIGQTVCFHAAGDLLGSFFFVEGRRWNFTNLHLLCHCLIRLFLGNIQSFLNL